MKKILLLCFFAPLVMAGCKNREREKQLAAREAALNEMEQQLLLREKTVEIREQELNQRIQSADSIAATDTSANALDSSAIAGSRVDTALTGNWSVKMTCIETSCSGSAIGDTKVEQWNLSYEGNHLVAKASDHGNLVRTYSGVYRDQRIELIEHRDTSMTYDTRMVVRLRPINANNMEGQREIIRENDCKIVYSLTLDKLKR